MIYLRELKTTDAALMLEWMHDEDIQKASNQLNNYLNIT